MIPNFVFKRARIGDTRAIERIVATLRPRVSRMAAYYGRLGYPPADLEQEAWAEMVTALRTLDLDIGVPEQYLLQRARWRVSDAVRRWKRRAADSLGDGEMQCQSLCHADDHSQTFVDDLIGRLEPTQKAVMNLLLSGSTWREAGDALGFTSANVAYHVRRVRTTYLAHYGD